MSDKGKIECAICGQKVHHIGKHLDAEHSDWDVERYQREWPEAPLVSKAREQALAERKREEQEMRQMVAKVIPFAPKDSSRKVDVNEAFEMPLTDGLRKATRGGKKGDPLQCDVFNIDSMDEADKEAIPPIDEGYVFDEDTLKDGLLGLQMGIPALYHGLHGTGKTTFVEQMCARTNRPWIRVQHSETTEESHITGQYVVRNGATEFDYGPLAEAMMRGWVYVADEYDFAHPSVIAVYQAVLEGKDLYIKEAPPAMRRVKPHPNFRFIATGNTNGSGDDTGLYAGTKIGNAAAYSRFGITVEVHYPVKEIETSMLKTRLKLTEDLAEKMVDFATQTREMYKLGDISLPISPREVLRASMLAMVKGGKFRQGIALAYSNRLSGTEREAVDQAAQRIFG